jgi:hypothetical protein
MPSSSERYMLSFRDAVSRADADVLPDSTVAALAAPPGPVIPLPPSADSPPVDPAPAREGSVPARAGQSLLVTEIRSQAAARPVIHSSHSFHRSRGRGPVGPGESAWSARRSSGATSGRVSGTSGGSRTSTCGSTGRRWRPNPRRRVSVCRCHKRMTPVRPPIVSWHAPRSSCHCRRSPCRVRLSPEMSRDPVQCPG